MARYRRTRHSSIVPSPLLKLQLRNKIYEQVFEDVRVVRVTAGGEFACRPALHAVCHQMRKETAKMPRHHALSDCKTTTIVRVHDFDFAAVNSFLDTLTESDIEKLRSSDMLRIRMTISECGFPGLRQLVKWLQPCGQCDKFQISASPQAESLIRRAYRFVGPWPMLPWHWNSAANHIISRQGSEELEEATKSRLRGHWGVIGSERSAAMYRNPPARQQMCDGTSGPERYAIDEDDEYEDGEDRIDLFVDRW